MPKFALALIALLALSACGEEPQSLPTTPLIVKTATDDVRFNVEVATTPQQLQTGLMNRSTLAFNSGMIFNIYPVRPTAMWMKNTKIPLDMLFVAPDASISMIKENAVPMSEELIISRDPVRAVIELNAGQVKRHGIKVGDKVSHALLKNMLDTDETAAPKPAAPQAAPAAKPAVMPELDLNALPDPEKIGAPEPAPAPRAPLAEIPAPGKDAALLAPAPQPKAPAPAPRLPVPAPSL